MNFRVARSLEISANRHLAHRCVIKESDLQAAHFLGDSAHRRDNVVGGRTILLDLHLLLPAVENDTGGADFYHALRNKTTFQNSIRSRKVRFGECDMIAYE